MRIAPLEQRNLKKTNQNTMTSSFYITSPIYYVNDVPHIGHAYTSIACDVRARFERLKSENNNDVFFLTGTDEHGQKVEKSAISRGKTPQEFCNEVSQKFRNLKEILNLSNDDFIRTTENRHKKCAGEFWQVLEKNGWIYKDVYEGWYAVRDEAFYSEDEITDGKAPSGAEVEWHKEESYFFKLSAFQNILEKIYQTFPDFIQPQSKKNEVTSFVKSGLKDLSISRASFSWGVPVPGDEKHVMYVWLDALVNYLSALDYPDGEKSQKFWHKESGKVHIVGKDILRFHAIYWPAFLLGSKYNEAQLIAAEKTLNHEEILSTLPTTVFAHGWWTNEGQKISKSVGNVIDPLKELEWIETFGANREVAIDYFRYFLMREVPFGNDGDYNREHFISRVNAELVNNIGNLNQRSLSMLFKHNAGEIVDFSGFAEGEKLLEGAYELKEKLENKMTKFAFDQALFEVLSHASKCNEFVERNAPWNLKKEGKIDEMNQVLSIIAENLRVIAIALQAFLPTLSEKMLDILNIDSSLRKLEFIDQKNALKVQHKINEPKALFPRLQIKK